MMRRAFIAVFAFLLAACSAATSPPPHPTPQPREEPAVVTEPRKSPAPAPTSTPATSPAPAAPATTETVAFASGCFWCAEAVVQRLPGVISVRSGFTGGATKDPSYEDVCTGTTGHAEAIEIVYDPKTIPIETLLDWFWRMHDPTTLNSQGPDFGTQYRSGIYWHTEAQRVAAEKSKKDAQASFKSPIVTEITKAGTFYEAEGYHQNFYNGHQTQGYCRAVIAPKLHKLGLDEKK